MIILGINEDHNATAALLRDGKVIGCVSEERFTRIKNDTEYPYKAIDSLLQETHISPAEIDRVVIAGKDFDALQMRIKRTTSFKIDDYIREMREYWKPVIYENKTSDFWEKLLKEERFANQTHYYDYSFMDSAPRDAWPECSNAARLDTIVKHLGIDRSKIDFLDHHTCHAYYAYYASPHADGARAAVVTADGWGDGCNATVSIAENGTLREIHRTAMCNMARIYRWMTLLLGMRPNEHEYKVMGLAPYAKDYIREPAYRIFKETLIVDGLDFAWNKKPSDMYFYFRDKFEGLRFDGIAAGLQLWLEELLSEWITNIMTHTGTNILYYSGGLSMNVKANKVISELPVINDFYVPPSGGDESLAMGATYVATKRQGLDPLPLENAYLGYEITEAEAKEALGGLPVSINFKVFHHPENELIANLLAEGKVLGRCVGRMEFGARSLGNRAILCDPSRFENIRIINEKIKFRDFWMPFTPSILSERAADYIVNPKGIEARYMTVAFDSTPLSREHLKAAIHPYDFTVRPQLVSQASNPEYYALIKTFEKRTGIGSVLNTSLNLHGYPIVRTAKDAIETLMRSGLDGMIFPGLLLLKT